MGDAYTHIARDGRRTGRLREYFDALILYLKEQTDDNRDLVGSAAGLVDDVKDGYFTQQTHLVNQLEVQLTGLCTGDRKVWASLLYTVSDVPEHFYSLLELSPFVGQKVSFAKLSRRTLEIEGAIAHAIKALMEKQKGEDVKSTDICLLALSEENLTVDQVILLR